MAVIIGSRDTVAVNNENIYPMMSVFKIHQALAVCNAFDRSGQSLDTMMTIRRDALDSIRHLPSVMLSTAADSPLTP